MAKWPNGTNNKPSISSPYGPRDPKIGTSAFHYGTDFIGFSDVHAVQAGRVIAIGVLSGWVAGGLQVYIDHGNGIKSRTMHLASISVNANQTVSEGQKIGVMGATGNATGKCAHVEIRLANGSATDPVPWIAARIGENTRPTPPPFPLPRGWYFGPRSGPQQSVSGYHGNREHLRVWQQRMKDRGWDIEPDGLYGDQTDRIAVAFQTEKGVYPDGLIGEVTWNLAWTAPIS